MLQKTKNVNIRLSVRDIQKIKRKSSRKQLAVSDVNRNYYSSIYTRRIYINALAQF